jgi:hypothetical protein
MFKQLFFSIFLTLSLTYAQSQVVINEIMSNNQSTITDNNGDYSDWIELYNPGPSNINLHNYSLSDNIDSLEKWKFPNISLQPNRYLLIWCSGKDRTTPALHTNFSIDSRGESIYLSDDNNNVIDNTQPIPQAADIAYGRHTDASPNWFYLSFASPGSTNDPAAPLLGQLSDVPTFNIPGGLYNFPKLISLTQSDPNAEIRYTLDGSEPTENSPLYTGALTVQGRSNDPNYYSLIRTCYAVHPWLPDWNPPANNVFKATVIRARVFKTNYLPGPIVTHTYFIDPAMTTRYGKLPVVSIVSDPKNLFNDTTGIYVPGITYQPNTFYANYYKAWNRPANIEMFLPNGQTAMNGNFKIDVNGQSSPSSPQKGLNVNANADYGVTKIDYPLFENTNYKARYIQKFDKVKFRAWGSDRARGLFRDAYCHSFFTKSTLDLEAYQPVVVFIDGEYWGLQELRERNRDASYYESHYFINDENPGCDIIEGAGNNATTGDGASWDVLQNYIDTHNFSDTAVYSYIKTQIDVESFMLHYLASIYLSRADWPDQNEAKWRSKDANGKWKWILWDMDNTTAFYLNPWYNMFGQSINGSRGYGPSPLFNKFLENDQFKYDFLNLFADYMNTEFLPALANAKVDSMKAELDPYMNEYRLRWQANFNWTNQTDSMKWWMNSRPVYCKQHILTTFSINNLVNVTLDVSDSLKGEIKINTLKLDRSIPRTTQLTYPWSGQYFSGIPIPLTAHAKPGYRFIKWLPSNDTSASIIVNTNNNAIALTAVFDIDPNYIQKLPPMINEVMSSNVSTITDNYGDYDDWLEIYNPNNDSLDLANYFITDNLVMPARFKLLASGDSMKIEPHGHLLIWIDDDTEQGVLHSNFKFSSSGDFIALVDPDGETIVDSVSFGLLASDNSFGRMSDGDPNWTIFQTSTPDAANFDPTSVPGSLLTDKQLILYPNPVSTGRVYFNQAISFSVFNELGIELGKVKNATEFDVSSYRNGLYLIKTESGKMLRFIILPGLH